jgi:hypothetical protein
MNPIQSQYAPCPKCGSVNASKSGYTWWGGFVGPAILSHVNCNVCGTGYNSKTGKSNTNGIIIYVVASIALACVIFGGCAMLGIFQNQ